MASIYIKNHLADLMKQGKVIKSLGTAISDADLKNTSRNVSIHAIFQMFLPPMKELFQKVFEYKRQKH